MKHYSTHQASGRETQTTTVGFSTRLGFSVPHHARPPHSNHHILSPHASHSHLHVSASSCTTQHTKHSTSQHKEHCVRSRLPSSARYLKALRRLLLTSLSKVDRKYLISIITLCLVFSFP